MDEAHIYIYGLIDSWQEEKASEWGYVNLKDVKNQYESQKEAKKIKVHLHSEGGVVTEGFAIFDYLRSIGKPIEVVIEGLCASIATVIALAGDTRVMTDNATFFIHNPWGMVGGSGEQIQKYADELKRMEDDIAEFYAKKTKLSKDQLLTFMKEETYFSAEEALEHGFITEILSTMRAVALFNPKSKLKRKKKMSTTAKKDKKDKKKKFNKFFAKMFNEIFGDVKNIVLQDVNGTEINFPDVEEGETPAVGDAATVDGQPAEGEYTMPTGDVYTFSNGLVDAIEEAEEEEGEEAQLQEELDAANAVVASLKKKVKALKEANREQARKLNQSKSAMKKLKKMAAGKIDFDSTGDSSTKHKKKNNGGGQARSLWKGEGYKRPA